MGSLAKCARGLRYVVLLIAGIIALQSMALAGGEDWSPPVPEENGWDWIMLASGEWLGGELLGLHDDKLEFDSDELGEQSFDFADVEILRSPRLLTVGLIDKTTYTGTVIMNGVILKIQTATGELEIPRMEILGIIAGLPSEWNFWSAKISAGLVTRSGNTNQDDFNATALFRRQTTKTRFDLNYLGNYSKTNEIETINNHRLNAKFDYIISRTLFVTPISGELYSDEFQNIDLRSLISAGLGVDLIDRGDMEWFVQLGLGYQETRFVSVEPGTDDRESSAALIPGTSFNWDITEDIEFLLDFTAQLAMTGDGTVYHTYSLLSFELTSILNFDIGLTWDRVANPKPDAEGNVPQQDDIRTSLGLGVDF